MKLNEELLEHVPPGWGKLLSELIEKLKAIEPDMEVSQVKEKFGGLRFYASYSTKEAEDLITEAEELSYQTCEKCGEHGETDGWGKYWIRTLCPEHGRQYAGDYSGKGE